MPVRPGGVRRGRYSESFRQLLEGRAVDKVLDTSPAPAKTSQTSEVDVLPANGIYRIYTFTRIPKWLRPGVADQVRRDALGQTGLTSIVEYRYTLYISKGSVTHDRPS